MVRPDYFSIDYAINPHMQDAKGHLKKVNLTLAQTQWQNLQKVFTDLGIYVYTCPAIKGLPDMVFSANHGLIFDHQIITSQMATIQRREEVSFMKVFLNEIGIDCLNIIPEELKFEGTGDAIWNAEKSKLFGGYGFRTDLKVYDILQEKCHIKVIPLQLVSEYFYHLDTCFCILDQHTVAYVPEAFSQESVAVIESEFKKRIVITREEGIHHFAGNAFCPDQKHVVLQSGASQFCQQLKSHGFVPIEVETSEFIKAGGSVFCMKLEII
jgi:N-dimethylarginine dimethylaminohydrolase